MTSDTFSHPVGCLFAVSFVTFDGKSFYFHEVQFNLFFLVQPQILAPDLSSHFPVPDGRVFPLCKFPPGEMLALELRCSISLCFRIWGKVRIHLLSFACRSPVSPAAFVENYPFATEWFQRLVDSQWQYGRGFSLSSLSVGPHLSSSCPHEALPLVTAAFQYVWKKCESSDFVLCFGDSDAFWVELLSGHKTKSNLKTCCAAPTDETDRQPTPLASAGLLATN